MVDSSLAIPYLYNIEYDKQILPMRSVIECNSCSLKFAHPMPDLEMLATYYHEVYRAYGRPHHISGAPPVRARHLAYLSFISLFLDLKEVKDVFEIGAGWGETGRLLKKINPDVSLQTVEPDSHVQEQLRVAGYQIQPGGSETNRKHDLVISTHSFEHFSSIGDFFALTESLRRGGHFFVEVPNCSSECGWLDRPYDSPHLLFFDSRTLIDSFERHGFEAIIVREAGIPVRYNQEEARVWKENFQAWTPSDRFVTPPGMTLRLMAHRVLPASLVEIFRAVLSANRQSWAELAAPELTHTVRHGSVIRALFRKT